ncbi:molecular chaperone GrpE (heat shock protein) [Stackebrandtia endophytica]|uniref:Protein GrpE n=1 Tax=Stackebrandtia endophytica TaxID=1496996 RepID=A0A543AXF7_9ACTN|nr:nucleotide exchange factor GrpE [Stackebrandtia endophytica]TQL77256.1 molecular chaperone GrpE (heat shock protein) [Stackebrandtia endophytica]
MTSDKTPEGSDNGESTAEETTAETAEPDAVETAAAGELAEALDERTRDLQRITAEYHNYRKRVERDRQAAADQATVNVVAGLLPVLDDIDRARDHGDLVGPFGSVAEQLLNSLTKLGLEVFGDKGDPFDPTVHEAVAHMHSNDVTEATCIDVMRRGYRLNDRLVRAAMVAVAEPSDEPAPTGAESAGVDKGDSEATSETEVDDAAEAGASTEDEVTSEETGAEATKGSDTEQDSATEQDSDTESDSDVDEATGEKSTGATTENVDADVPADEEALKGETVEAAVAEASDADAEPTEGADSSDESADLPTDSRSASETGNDGSGDK